MTLDDMGPKGVAAALRGEGGEATLGDQAGGSDADPHGRASGPLDFAREHTILYVDDEEENLLVFHATFDDEFDIVCAGSAREALEILERDTIAVLLADKRMPEMDGIELCERVRRDYPETRRMLITAFSDQRTAIDAINRGGVQHYVIKPWSEGPLRETLRSVVTQVHLSRLAQSLDQALLENERLHGEAVTRAKLLHDLGNVSQCLVNACANLQHLAEQLTGGPGDVADQIREEIGNLRHALDMVVGIQEERPTAREEAREPVPIAELVQTVAMVVGPRLRDARVQLEVDCRTEAVALARRLSVSRILVNLVKNAHEAMEEAGTAGPTIRITAHPGATAGTVEVDVSDNGPGVPESRRAWIFGQTHSTKGGPGRGIGLSVSAELARANGGSLVLLRRGQLGGATFRLTLPLAGSE